MEQETTKDVDVEKKAEQQQPEAENVIIAVFKKLLGWNYHEYGTKKEVLK